MHGGARAIGTVCWQYFCGADSINDNSDFNQNSYEGLPFVDEWSRAVPNDLERRGTSQTASAFSSYSQGTRSRASSRTNVRARQKRRAGGLCPRETAELDARVPVNVSRICSPLKEINAWKHCRRSRSVRSCSIALEFPATDLTVQTKRALERHTRDFTFETYRCSLAATLPGN